MTGGEYVAPAEDVFERQHSGSLSNPQFAGLVGQVGLHARRGAPWACRLLYRWLAVEESDTRRVILLKTMIEVGCRDCPLDMLTRLVAVPHTDVCQEAAHLLVLAGPSGERALLATLGRLRGYLLAISLGQLASGNGPLDVATVASYANHPNQHVRLGTLGTLAVRGDGTCTGKLAAAIDRSDIPTRDAALTALVTIGGPDAVDAVLKRLSIDAARRSRPETLTVELALNYLGQHAQTRPDALTHARTLIVDHWHRRDEAEIAWIRKNLPQVAPETPEPISPPSSQAAAGMRRPVLARLHRMMQDSM
ncbi:MULTISPECIES: HEAT repeat domain-containing protein [unclassified Pseudofrankia]|uniref:HEAT repeat domain-containing protein n=1 Tax=unclassified Pseudofrankia TaxID=2994372 RepID=UPI0008DA08C1|nr:MULTISPECIES: HEAT repeat domain-containing protein [unclassified Pseudofrankia]MDT3440648.1 HEAT repeat domain-containing protein [Pseudofrankia sp. BMG5.37]OHV60577.1 hypothetical protein BCD48_05430 [Pseudofrankia sp. BMG5.36]